MDTGNLKKKKTLVQPQATVLTMDAKYLTSYPALSAAVEKINLQGKSALITGGGYGLGTEIARAFASRNISQIILVGRTEAKLKDAADSLSPFPSTKVTYRTADISSKSDVKRLFESLDTSPDFLINNAGYLSNPASFVEGDLEEWWKGFTINVFGTALLTQSYFLHRRSLGGAEKLGPAVVITLNTIGAFNVRLPKLSGYSASKAALARWSELMGEDISASEARFVSVHPGTVETAMADKSGLAGVFPLTEAKLVGEFLTWLTSDDAGFLSSRFVWVNWDVEELLRRKEEIVSKDLLISTVAQ